MKKKITSRVLSFSLLAALLLSFFIYPSGNVSAAAINISADSSAVENVSPAAVYTKYVTVNKRTTTFPASRIYHVEWVGNFKYAGYLDRFDYAHDPDAGLYFATYKGNISIK